MAKKKSTKKTVKNATRKSPASSFTPFEIASIAAQFLPSIVTGHDWEQLRGIALARQLEANRQIPGNFEEDQFFGCDHRTGWEVLCDEAIQRAETLLQTAAGVDLRESAQMRAGKASVANCQKTFLEMAEPWKKKFKRRAKGRKEVPLDECLKWILPRSRNPRAHYNKIVKTRPELRSDSVCADRFANLAILIKDFGEETRKQTVKDLERKGGEKGGMQSAKLRES